jgi:hypothetical protein
MKNIFKVTAIFAGILLSVAVAAAGSSGPNNVYIEQIGNSNLLTIEQVGGGNNIGGVANDNLSVATQTNLTTLSPTVPSPTNYGTINGSNNILTMTQHGDTNSAQYKILGSNNNYTSLVIGNNNQTHLSVGDITHPTNLRNVFTEFLTGSNNLVLQQVTGNDITDNITAVGNGNQITNNFLSTNGTSDDVIHGNYNVVVSEQIDSAGATGHTLWLNTTGDYNSITTQQQGFNDTTVNIDTTGSHNTITVRTSNSLITNPVSAVIR